MEKGRKQNAFPMTREIIGVRTEGRLRRILSIAMMLVACFLPAAPVEPSSVPVQKTDTGSIIGPTDQEPSHDSSEEVVVFPQMSHSGVVNDVAISSDGNLAVTASHDKTLKLWQVASGRSIRTFAGHEDGVYCVVFSPDGKTIVSGSRDRTVRVWDVRSGQEIRRFKGHTNTITGLSISPDGQRILSSGLDHTIRLWDLQTGQELNKLSGHDGPVKKVVFSPNGREALSASDDGTVKMWNLASGLEIWSHRFSVTQDADVVYSPDGTLFATSRYLTLWDARTGQKIRSLVNELHDSPGSMAFSPNGERIFTVGRDGKAFLWDVASGKKIRTFEDFKGLSGYSHHASQYVAPSMSKAVYTKENGRVVFGIQDAVILFDVDQSKIVHVFGGQAILFDRVGFLKEGRQAFSSENGTLTLWDLSKGKLVSHLNGDLLFPTPDNSQALRTTGTETTLWDLVTNSKIRDVRTKPQADETDEYERVQAVSPDNTLALWMRLSSRFQQPVSNGADEQEAVAEDTSSLRHWQMVWNIDQGKMLHAFEVPYWSGGKAVFSQDGEQILSGGEEDSGIRLYESRTGRLIRPFEGGDHHGFVSHLAFSKDGKTAISSSADNGTRLYRMIRPFFSYLDHSIKFWNVSDGKEFRTYVGHDGSVNSFSISPDGTTLLSGSADGTMKLWKMPENSIPDETVFSYDDRWSPKETLLQYLKEIENRRKNWNNHVIHTYRGHAGEVNGVAFAPQGDRLLSASEDGTVRLWDRESGAEIARFIFFHDKEWVVFIPEGYYNASENGHKHLNIRKGNAVFGIDQFYDVFYRPDIVSAKLMGQDIRSLITLTVEEAIKHPPPQVEIHAGTHETQADRLPVRYTVTSAGGGVGEVRIFHNGKLVHSSHGHALPERMKENISLTAMTGQVIHEQMRGLVVQYKESSEPKRENHRPAVDRLEEEISIEAVPGANEISIAAFNAQNSVQSLLKTVRVVSTRPPSPPHLYLLAIGIDHHRDPSINLSFAAKDAQDLAQLLADQFATLYPRENIHIVRVLNQGATRSGILRLLDQMAEKIRPSDQLVIFVASHGILLGGHYHMVTHDYDGRADPESNLIASDLLVAASTRIRALSQWMIFDTCHAGGIDNVVTGLYDARMSVLAKRMGLHIFASANSHEQALDGYKGNGLFSHTLIQGLTNQSKADLDQDRYVSLVELGRFSRRATQDIAQALSHTQEPVLINFGQDVPIYRLP